MQQSYSKNYLKIYLWQGVSLVLNFLSMYVVIPFLTSDPITFGIYSVCLSFAVFIVYADLGFMGAGQKYAAEYFAKGDRVAEIKVVGFTNFVLLIFLLLFSTGFFILSQNPELLVKGIVTPRQHYVASSLFLILAVFTPTTLLERILQMIFSVRMEDFILQRTNIVANLIKILSILWFFRAGEYNIVGYFLFIQVMNLLAAGTALIIARRRYRYDFKSLFTSIYFNKPVFHKIKGLAFASLFITISWILYYELDSISIAKFLGVQHVAFYAIGLTVLSFFRSILGILFSPFNIRFNHFVGAEDETGLKGFFLQIVTVMAPFVVFPILILSVLAKPIVFSWVGAGYADSVAVVQLLVFCNCFAFITYPTNFLLIARNKQKSLYIVYTLMPFIFWTGIALTIHSLGVQSFAVFKLFAFLISAVVMYKVMIDYLNLGIFASLKTVFLPMLLPVLFLVIASLLVRDFLPFEKSKFNLLVVAAVMIGLLVVSFVLQYFSSSVWRGQIKKVAMLLK